MMDSYLGIVIVISSNHRLELHFERLKIKFSLEMG